MWISPSHRVTERVRLEGTTVGSSGPTSLLKHPPSKVRRHIHMELLYSWWHLHQYILSDLNLFFKLFLFFSDASPRCVIPEDIELVRQYPMSRRKAAFHKVIHYKCTLTDKNVKQATCVSGRWTPEIACTGVFLHLHHFFWCRHDKCSLLRILSIAVSLGWNNKVYLIICWRVVVASVWAVDQV